MKTLLFVSLFGWIAFSGAMPSSSSVEEPPLGGDNNEAIDIHEGLVLEPEDPPKDLISVNYPSEAPANLLQSWSILSYSPDSPTNLKITCEEFNLPFSDPCENFEMMIDDGDDRHNLCGEKKDFTFTTKSEGATILIATGPQGGGKIKCQAQAVIAE